MQEQPNAPTEAATGGPFPWTRERTRQYVEEMTRHRELKGHWITRMLIGMLGGFVRLLSWKGTDRLGTGIGYLLYWLRVRRDVAMINLDIAFGDRKTKAEKNEIYKQSLLNLGRHVLNYLRVPLMDDQFWQDFEFANENLLREIYNRGKGIIFIGGHIGEWEIAAGRVGMAGYPIAIVAKKLSNPIVDKLILDARVGMNLGTVAHRDSMDRVREGLQRGEGIIMAIDQNMKRSQGVFVEWLGRTASTVRSNAWLARETGTPVVAGFAYRCAPGRYRLEITEEVPWEPHPEDPDEELVINTRNQAKAVEKIIYDHPELWHWIHRRWKVQPKGEPNPYEK